MINDKILKAVAQVICDVYGAPDGRNPVSRAWQDYEHLAQAAIDAYLKALEKEGKCVISKHDLQELTTNRAVYEG